MKHKLTSGERSTTEAALLEATGEYLKSIGWAALVASVDRVQTPSPFGRKYEPNSFELVVRFTGVPPATAKKETATNGNALCLDCQKRESWSVGLCMDCMVKAVNGKQMRTQAGRGIAAKYLRGLAAAKNVRGK